jgi:hypothetical protein
MSAAWIPVWIIGGPFLGLLFLSAIFQGGTSASSERATFGEGEEFHRASRRPAERRADVGMIAQLSGYVSPGAISRLSGPVSPGAIATLSRWVSPGAIAKLSAYKSPGAIARLSGYKSPGAIARLSSSKPVGAIASLSEGFYVSKLFGLPLLTRSQAPLEPDDTLLTSDHRDARR